MLISDLLDSPHKAQVYSKINLCHAYYLVCIADSDEWKTVFRIYNRSFEWSIIPFSLTNAPMAFQQFMNNIFSNLLDVCVIIYLDDILIYLNNMSEHHRHVKEVLKYLCKAGFYTKAEKCKFHSKSVEYLRYILSPSGFTMYNNKVKIIQDWPESKKVKDIQSFLGFANFYHRFIFNYLNIVIPLTHLTHWIPDTQLIVETDALDYALAAILFIVDEDNKGHLVVFHSYTFTVAELNYGTHDKELLAIFKAFKIWQHYLEGLAYSINVVIDHKNLEYFSNTKVFVIRQVCGQTWTRVRVKYYNY